MSLWTIKKGPRSQFVQFSLFWFTLLCQYCKVQWGIDIFTFLASIQRIKTTFWESNWKLFNKNLNFSKCTFEILIGTISWGLDHAGLNVQYFELLCNQFEPALVVQDCLCVCVQGHLWLYNACRRSWKRLFASGSLRQVRRRHYFTWLCE